jgi:hypothetical protein
MADLAADVAESGFNNFLPTLDVRSERCQKSSAGTGDICRNHQASKWMPIGVCNEQAG